MFFIAILAETNRPPFDLPEAESELVAGFMTEHGASIFVFFFLGEYSSLVLMSSFMTVFFLGGYHCPDLHNIMIDPFIIIYYYFIENLSPYYYQLYEYFNFYYYNFVMTNEYSHQLILPQRIVDDLGNYMTKFDSKDTVFNFINILIDKIYGSYILGVKIIIVVFFYI
jgi:hypothetical protein